MHDFIVVGAGIAGLATAELLQRSGRSVLLLEAEDKICAHSTAQQQGWFHTGALYAALPSSRYFRQLVGNLDDLFNYYSSFPRMNLRSGRTLLTQNSTGWFKNSNNYYFYASPSSPEIERWQKPLWYLATLRAQTRLSWFETIDFTRELSPQIKFINFSPNLSRCLSNRDFHLNPGIDSKIMKSRDRTFDADCLMTDLLHSFLASGGKLMTNAIVSKASRRSVSDQSGTYKAQHVIVSTGRNVGKLTGVRTKVLKSPLLVVKPAILDFNFAWMTMDMQNTFNHMYHCSDHGGYSLIGNAIYFGVDEQVDEAAIKNQMIEKAQKIFDIDVNEQSADLYFGIKTEIVDEGHLRNYQYHIIDGGEAVVALPGKMSLAFSLAVNVCRHFGIDPVTDAPRLDDQKDQGASAAIAKTEHYRRSAAMS